MQALTGSLETVDLASLLEFLAASRATGMLQVESLVVGRLFFDSGELTYATTRKDESGLEGASKGFTGDHDRRATRADALAGLSRFELLSEQLPEVLVRLTEPGWGTFVFHTERAAPFEVEHRFDVPRTVAAASARMRGWAQIREFLPSTSAQLVLSPRSPGEVVRLDARSWAVVTAIGSGSSAAEVAQQLGIFEYAAAAKIAELVRRGLIVLVDESPAVPDARRPAAQRPPKPNPPSDHVTTVETPPLGELTRRWRELKASPRPGTEAIEASDWTRLRSPESAKTPAPA